MLRLFWLLCLALLLGGCSSQQASPTSSSAFPIDDLGRSIALKGPAQRVVVIAPGAIETVFALGAGGQLVGRDDYADFPPAAKKIAVAGNYQGPNVEQCVALRPDLVILQGETWNQSRVDDWQQKIGVPVAALTPSTLGQLAQDTEKIGSWLGKEAAAKKLANQIRQAQRSNQSGKRPTVLIETGRSPLWIAGSGTLISDVAATAGLRNIADDLRIEGYQQVGLESVLAKPSDYYLVASIEPRSAVLRELRQSPGLSKLKCVQSGHVLVVDGNLLLRPGPRLLQGITQLQKATAKPKLP